MSSVLTPTEIRAAVEIAEHNEAYREDGALVVWDSRVNDRYYGFVIEVEPAASEVGGWIGRCSDGVGKSASVHRTERLAAAWCAYVGWIWRAQRVELSFAPLTISEQAMASIKAKAAGEAVW